MTLEQPSRKVRVFQWADTSWVVAVLLGLWGVLLSIDAFLLANIVVALAAISAAITLSNETFITTKRRKTKEFIVGLFVIIALLGVDLWWTAKQKTGAEERDARLLQLNRIPKLQDTIDAMKRAEQETARRQAKSEGALTQKLEDIGGDNKRLKSSIETKDAALTKIAEEQYALNFAPEVMPYTKDLPNEMWFQNQGKTAVVLKDFFCEPNFPLDAKDKQARVQIPPNSMVSLLLNLSQLENYVLQQTLQHADGRVPIECQASIETADGKTYSLGVTWVFVVKGGVVSRSFAIPRPIVN